VVVSLSPCSCGTQKNVLRLLGNDPTFLVRPVRVPSLYQLSYPGSNKEESSFASSELVGVHKVSSLLANKAETYKHRTCRRSREQERKKKEISQDRNNRIAHCHEEVRNETKHFIFPLQQKQFNHAKFKKKKKSPYFRNIL
jgi:hypothetical protein